MSRLIDLDGSLGEGGGQIIRTALALSLLTGRPLQIRNVRGRRANPGLQAQHVACVNAAISVGGIVGAQVEQHQFALPAAAVVPGERLLQSKIDLDVGGSGSAALVVQSILPVLLLRCRPDVDTLLTVKGGTHTGLCPTVEFMVDTFTPVLARMGFHCRVKLNRYGVMPMGGGVVSVTIRGVESSSQLRPLKFLRLHAGVASLMTRSLTVQHTPDRPPEKAAPSQLMNVRAETVTQLVDTLAQHAPDTRSFELPCRGSAVLLVDRFHVTPAPVMVDESQSDDTVTAPEESAAPDGWSMVLTSVMGPVKNRDVSEKLGTAITTLLSDVDAQATRWIAAKGRVAVDEYLCDQLLLPLAIGVGGTFTTTTLSLHTFTNAWLINHVLGNDCVTFHHYEGTVEGVVGAKIELPEDPRFIEDAAAAYGGGCALVTVAGCSLS